MRTSKVCLFLTMLLVLGMDVRAQSDSKEPSGVISGKVTIEDVPAPGVPVLLLKSTNAPSTPPVARVSTDADGNYRISDIAAGEYRVNAFAPAFYYPTSEYYGPRGKSVSLRDAEIADGVDFKLVRGSVITGRVTDSSGRPVVEEYIKLSMIDENGKELPIPYGDGFQTDDRGTYRVYGLEPGRYLISVGHPPGNFSMGGPGRFYQLTYHPGVIERQSAAVVEVGSGGEATGIDIVLGKMNVSYAVSGRVIDADTGKGLPGITMGYGSRLPDDKGVGARGYNPTWQSGTTGDFRLEGVPPGHYAAFGVPPSDSDFYSDLAFFDIADGDVEGVEIKLHRGATITGVVALDPTTDPALNTMLMQLRLSATPMRNSGNPRYTPAPISPDGSFRIAGVTAGKNRMILMGSEPVKGFYISRVQRDGAEQPGGLIDVGAGDQVTGVLVTVSYGTGVIRGQVKYVGGLPPPTVEISVVARLAGDLRGAKYATVDSRGLFVIEGVRDGDYDLTLEIYSRSPGQEFPSPHQKATVTQGSAADVIFVVDLGKKT